MKFSRSSVVLGVVLAQLIVLAGELGYCLYPHITGKEVLLATAPVDPRSLFRGQYVRLSFEISRISVSFFDQKERESLEVGDTVYVVLKEHDGVYKASSASSSKPSGTTYIAGTVSRLGGSIVNVRYGLEAYFANPERAKELETQRWERRGTRDGRSVVRVRLARNGQAALVGFEG